MLEKTRTRALLSAVLLFAMIMSSTIDVPVYSLSEMGNIHGTIIDEDGGAIQGVKVMVYSSSRLLYTDYTDIDGLFRFALDSGSYSLTFEKEGYASSDKDVSVPEGGGYYLDPVFDPVNLGEIPLQKALRISTSVLSRVVSPGKKVSFPFTLSNIGEKAEDVQFSTLNSAGWKTRVLDSTGEIKRVLLTSGSLNLYLEVDVPSGADATAVTTLTAMGKTNATLEFTLEATSSLVHDVEITSSYPSISAELGRTIYCPLTISNTGQADETVELEGIAPSGWLIRFRSTQSTQTEVLSLSLASGQSESLTVELVQPEDAEVAEYSLTLKALSEDGVLIDSLNLRVTLREVVRDVKVISTFTDITAEAGRVIQYPVTIWNNGDSDVLMLLTVLSAPDNWKTVFISEDTEVSSILVTAGEYVSLKLQVTPPSVVETGDYPIIIGAESDDGAFTKRIEMEAHVVGSYELTISLSTLYTTISTGGSTTFTARLTNSGQSPVTALYIEATNPDEWDVSISPVQIASLAARDSTTFSIVVKNPADTVAGDYIITLKASSDQVESDEAQLRVTAQASTSWGFIGLGVAVVVIVGLVVVFMRFKRR